MKKAITLLLITAALIYGHAIFFEYCVNRDTSQYITTIIGIALIIIDIYCAFNLLKIIERVFSSHDDQKANEEQETKNKKTE